MELEQLRVFFWIWSGSVDFIQGRKNKDKQRQDDGSDSMTNGVYLAIASAGIAAAIVAALSQIKFLGVAYEFRY